jgi:hypothetical protein
MEASGLHVEFVRVPYNVDEAADAIRVSDLPGEFAEILKSGGVTASTSPAIS